MQRVISDGLDHEEPSVLSVSSLDNVSRCHGDGSSGEVEEDLQDHVQPTQLDKTSVKTSVLTEATLGVQITEAVRNVEEGEETPEKKYYETWACFICLIMIFVLLTVGPSLLLLINLI